MCVCSFVCVYVGLEFSTGQPKEISGRLEINLQGRDSKLGPLQTVLLKATVGEAKLSIPKSLEVCTYEVNNEYSILRLF